MKMMSKMGFNNALFNNIPLLSENCLQRNGMWPGIWLPGKTCLRLVDYFSPEFAVL